MHHRLYEQLRVNTFLLQFYSFLNRGNYSITESESIESLIEDNIDRLNRMRSIENWDGNYNFVIEQVSKSREIIENAKSNLPFKQICEDIIIAKYVEKKFDFFFNNGILLNDLKNILEIDILFRNGYMLHDVYCGYVEKGLYRYQIDCLDFLYSAAHFYNEGLDYYNDKKQINLKIPISENYPYDSKRIQSKEEVMFRNFREAFINIIFFVESFINSVGFDAYLAGFGINEDEKNKLKGIQSISSNNFKIYSNMRQKIKNISKILNNDSVDTNSEPYISYLQESVELRNQYVHSSPDKERLSFGVDDWKNKCDRMINNECLDFLNAFWEACYPDKTFPKIIFNVFAGNSFKGHQGKFVQTE